MNDFKDYIAADARLIILRELGQQQNLTSNETILSKVLDTFGHHRSREWARQQLRYLADIEAVEITQAGTVIIAKLNRTGRDHIEGRTKLEGVLSPSET